MLGLTSVVLGVSAVSALQEQWRPICRRASGPELHTCSAQEPLVLVGTPYIIIAAYAVRSLPASVRAGVAALRADRSRHRRSFGEPGSG
jgi:ABC-type Fe3+ transport system permease subunit